MDQHIRYAMKREKELAFWRGVGCLGFFVLVFYWVKIDNQPKTIVILEEAIYTFCPTAQQYLQQRVAPDQQRDQW
jgi:hypothetical protein